MRRLCALLFLLGALWFSCGPGVAAGNKLLRVAPYAAAPLPTCPLGSSFADGCSTAPAPLTASFFQPNAFQPGDYLNTTAHTPGNYMHTNCGVSGTALCRPPWNVACFDYACGNYTPALATCSKTVATFDGSCLLDPAISVPTGCAYSTSASFSGGNLVTCSGASFAGVFQHFNMGPINGHDCTALRINSTPVTTFLYDDNYWFNNSGLCVVFESSSLTTTLINNVFSGGIVFSNFVLDGNSGVWDNKYGGISTPTFPCDGATVACNPQNAINAGANHATYQYFVIKNFAATPLNPQQNSQNSASIFQYGLIQTWCVRVPNCHSEWFNGGGGTGGVGHEQWSYITVTGEGSDFGNSQAGPVPIFWCNAPVCPIANFSIDHVTQVNPYIGGLAAQSATFSGCIGNPPTSLTGGNPTTPVCPGSPNGNVFYVTASTVPLSHGLQLPFGGTGGGSCLAFGTYKRIAGPYPPNVIDEWSIDQSNGVYYPNYNIAGTCTNATASAQVANIGFANGGASHIGSMAFDSNYMDVSSQGGGASPSIWNIGNGGNPPQVSFNGTVTGAGTTLTSTSGTVSFESGQTISGTGLGNCATAVFDCPTIVTGGSGTVFTITPAVTNIPSPIAMTGLYPTWCDTPAAFTNNVDMTAVAPASWLNKWSLILTFHPVIGC